MTIRTKESLSGFIASDPQLTFTSAGDARFYARVRQEHFQRQDDGSFTQLDSTFTDLVMFRKSAERAHAQFQKGDGFIAEGETRAYTQNVNGQDVERDQFIASRVGHDNNITTYEVDRSRPERDTTTRDATTRDIAAQEPRAAALAERETQLEPEPTTTASAAPASRDAVTR